MLKRVKTGGKTLIAALALLIAPAAWADTQNQTPVKSLALTGDALVVSLLQGQSTCTADLSGTWTGTVTFAVSGNLQTSWMSPVVVNQDGSQGSFTQTGNGTWRFDCAGFTNARVLLSAAGTGTVTARLTTSVGALTAGGTQNVNVVKWSGGSTATVKPASTAAVATDLAEVVTFSPNTPLPAGTNSIGGVTGLPTSGNTSSQFGTATAPTAGAAVATLAAPGAGNYSLSVSAYVGAGAAAADANNMQLKVGAVVVATLAIPPVANGAPVVVTFPRVSVPAATAVTVTAVGAATATVPYSALIVATPVN